MASYRAITATGEAILNLLKAAIPPPEFETVPVKLYRPVDFTDPLVEGISLYLYRVAVNTSRRTLPARTDSNGRRYSPALPIDLHYLLTPWARTAEKQHLLLGWSMRILEDTPLLSSELLNPDVFRPNETLEVVCEPLSLQEIVNIWDAFKPNLQVSVAYVIRMVALDSLIEQHEAPLVQTRIFDMAKGPV